MIKKVISYGGYYSTGGSIIRDLIREFEPSIEMSIEFRLIKERYGLLDLEDSIFQQFAAENIDLAINDFLWLANNLARKSGKFRKAGFSYDERTCGLFSVATKNFIDQISDYKYPMSWHFQDFKKSYLSQMYQRIKKKIFVKNVRIKEGENLGTIAYPTEENIFLAARNYMNTIIKGIQQFNNCDRKSVVGLHNAIPPYSIELINRSMSYFDSCKLILIDRDPRDVFMNYPKDSYGRYLPQTNDIMLKARSFVHFFKSIRKNQELVKNHSSVLFIQFEDFCLNYDKCYDMVMEFSDLNKANHKNKFKMFNPEISKKNIGMWKKTSNETLKAINLIEKELENFLYSY